MPESTDLPQAATDVAPTATEANDPNRTHPTAETIKHLRHQIRERMPETQRIFDKSGTTPTNRELINAAGEQLRDEMESDYDPLTGALTLKGYNKRKERALNTAQTTGLPITVAGIDLDNLKKVNDKQGHEAGDRLLISASRALIESSRLEDLIVRKGGDEFEALLINTDVQNAQAWVARVRQALESKGVEASIGTCAADPNNFDEAVKTADQAMYEEKRIHHASSHPSVISRMVRPVLKLLGKAA